LEAKIEVQALGKSGSFGAGTPGTAQSLGAVVEGGVGRVGGRWEVVAGAAVGGLMMLL
jgi:hypothetical protein